MNNTNNIHNMSVEIDESLITLETLPDIIELYIENYGLENKELTAEQKYDFSNSSETLYSLLTLTQRTIRELKKTQNEITSRYLKSSRNTETTTQTDQS